MVLFDNAFNPVWRGRPPQMAQREREIFFRFLDRYQSQVRTVFYDVMITSGLQRTIPTEPEFQRQWEHVTAKRIDAVCETAEGWWCIEIKVTSSGRALGQIMLYKSLWEQYPPDNRPVRWILLSEEPDPDLVYAAAGSNVELIVI